MSDFFLVAGGVMLLLIPISLIIWVVQAIRKKPTKKNKIICLGCVVLFLVFEVVGMATRCSHAWQNATCTSPKTCSLCGEIEGEPLAHTWVEATCTEPRTCSVCGETTGTPMGHTWKEATCAAPRTCSVCGETDGTPIAHAWEDATCTEPKICSLCGETEGEPLGHIEGEWIYDEPDLLTSIVMGRKYCQVCGERLDSDIKSLKYMYENGKFLFSPEVFSERLNGLLPYIDGCNLSAMHIITDDGTMGSVIYDGAETIGITLFYNENDTLDETYSSISGSFMGGFCQFQTDDMEDIVDAVIGIILTCDPQLEPAEAADVAREALVSTVNESAYYKNGIGYVLGVADGQFSFVFSLKNEQTGKLVGSDVLDSSHLGI